MSEPRAVPRDVVERFYSCFARRDGRGMAELYAADATFSDPVFRALRGEEVGAMWIMLTGQARDLEVTLDSLEARDADVFEARWTARYTFSATGKKVVNRVTSTIRLRDGLIAEQRDDFDFAAWQAQAFGLAGRLLGWTGALSLLIRRKAAASLEAFRRRNRP